MVVFATFAWFFFFFDLLCISLDINIIHDRVCLSVLLCAHFCILFFTTNETPIKLV